MDGKVSERISQAARESGTFEKQMKFEANKVKIGAAIDAYRDGK